MNTIKKFIEWYFSRESLPYWGILIVDCVVVFLSTLFTYWVFNKTQLIFNNRFEVVYTALVYSLLSIIGAKIFSTYSGVMRYSSFIDLLKLAYANIVNVVIAVVLSMVCQSYGLTEIAALTQTQTVITFVVATLVLWGLRVVVKTLFEIAYNTSRAQRVLIYGAMSGGVGIAKNIRSQRPLKFKLCGFISHDKRVKHLQLMGEKVYNMDDDLTKVIREKRIKAILVSPLRAKDFRDNLEIQDLLIGAGCRIYMAQAAKEANIVDGQLSEEDYESMQLKEVSVEDLLPRGEINVDLKSVRKMLTGKRVLITGAAGSIGSEIVKQVATFKPESMMLIDQAETPEHDIRLMMARDFPDVNATTIVTSITHQERMERIFSDYKPNYVFHAAAYKHVPMMEDNPSEAVFNNIFGTKVIADLSVKYGVDKFVMISTDKAVNPTNVMGCSKRICEIYVQSLNRKLRMAAENKAMDKNGVAKYTQFVTTRFGNVLGSNGSVIPLFKEQIKKGGPVTVTDERIVRFFMLIPEACKLVLEAGTKGNGGEIFVFDMGKPVKIADLAKRMIALSNAKNVEIKFTGLREGEKLYEEVLNELENTKPTFHEKIRIAEVREYEYNAVKESIDELFEIAGHFDNMNTVRKMKEIVPEYKSNNSVYQQLDAEIEAKATA